MEYAFSLMDYKRHTIFEKKKLSRERNKKLDKYNLDYCLHAFLTLLE